MKQLKQKKIEKLTNSKYDKLSEKTSKKIKEQKIKDNNNLQAAKFFITKNYFF